MVTAATTLALCCQAPHPFRSVRCNETKVCKRAWGTNVYKMRVTGSRVYSRPAPVPKMPDGLVELMEGLTRDVLKNNPPNVYEFCAGHMWRLLEIRDGPSTKRTLSLEQKISKARDSVKKRAEERWKKINEERQQKTTSEDVDEKNSSQVQPQLQEGDVTVKQAALKPVHSDHNLTQTSEIEISCESANAGIQDQLANENFFQKSALEDANKPSSEKFKSEEIGINIISDETNVLYKDTMLKEQKISEEEKVISEQENQLVQDGQKPLSDQKLQDEQKEIDDQKERNNLKIQSGLKINNAEQKVLQKDPIDQIQDEQKALDQNDHKTQIQDERKALDQKDDKEQIQDERKVLDQKDYKEQIQDERTALDQKDYKEQIQDERTALDQKDHKEQIQDEQKSIGEQKGEDKQRLQDEQKMEGQLNVPTVHPNTINDLQADFKTVQMHKSNCENYDDNETTKRINEHENQNVECHRDAAKENERHTTISEGVSDVLIKDETNPEMQTNSVPALQEISRRSVDNIQSTSLLDQRDEIGKSKSTPADVELPAAEIKSSIDHSTNTEPENLINSVIVPDTGLLDGNESENQRDNEIINQDKIDIAGNELTNHFENAIDLEQVVNDAIENIRRKDSSANNSLKDIVLNEEESDESEKSNIADTNITISPPKDENKKNLVQTISMMKLMLN